ncbi:unnamed protein product, partial [Mesorhabditis spiculigera]
MSLPFMSPAFQLGPEQLRSCLSTIHTPASSSSSSPPAFSIEALLSSPRLPMPFSGLPLDLFHATAWPSAYPFFPSQLLSGGFFPPFLPTFLGGKRKRRHRTIFSEEQLQILERTFTQTHYPDVAMREKLAVECELKEERVEVWFKNRRAKERKQKREVTKQPGATKNSASDESDLEIPLPAPKQLEI